MFPIVRQPSLPWGLAFAAVRSLSGASFDLVHGQDNPWLVGTASVS
jgi:hypothetical protein